MMLKGLNLVLSIITFLFLFFILNEYFYTSLGIALSLYLFIDFVDKLGKIFPLKEFMLVIASTQWIGGAKLSYSFGALHHKYYMYVDEPIYMEFVVPGVILFALGLHVVYNNMNLKPLKDYFSKDTRALKGTGITLLSFGFISSIIREFISIPQLAFFLFLGNIAIYVGVIFFFFIYPKHKFKIYILVIGLVFIISLSSGMFHNLLLIAAFLSFFLVSEKTNFITKFFIIVLGSVFVYALQGIKSDYREIIWRKEVSNPIPIFTELFLEQFKGENEDIIYISEVDPNEENADINNRINQGWIISKIMANVPKYHPFEGGETILEGLKSSLVPRFLSPDKKGADYALKKFQVITGIPLSGSTAMGLSIIGEMYANFGYVGGIIGMFLYGIFISLIIKLIIKYLGRNNPLMLLWLILFFFQVVKAETESIKLINHLFKSIIFFLIIQFMLNAINVQLFPKSEKVITF